MQACCFILASQLTAVRFDTLVMYKRPKSFNTLCATMSFLVPDTPLCVLIKTFVCVHKPYFLCLITLILLIESEALQQVTKVFSPKAQLKSFQICLSEFKPGR